MQNSSFKCPFEIKGEKEGTIVQVSLVGDSQTRFSLIKKGFETFHSDTNFIALKFLLPSTLLSQCSSNEELKPLLLPYQTEIVAGEMDYRLAPMLPYQLREIDREAFLKMLPSMQYGQKARLQIALELAGIARGLDIDLNSVSDLSNWMFVVFSGLILEGAENPNFTIMFETDTKEIVSLALISSGNSIFITDRYPSVTDASSNKNCFTVVKTPFYPKGFGRYSENVELVLTREAHFASVPLESRQKIRAASNTVLKQGGVVISDVFEDKQPDGLWIPLMKQTEPV